MTELDTLIKMYFDVGMLYKDIVSTLSQQHNITISERHLIRKLTHLNLSRRTFSSFNDVTTFIQRQLVGSGQCHGYRMMYEKCIQHGLRVRKEDVRIILKELDPEGVESRMGRRLRRRLYYAKGPNYIWHLDGYDKLKPYGLCISGCIDGYSRKVIWLNVYHTNNDPGVVGGYFVEALKECGGCPHIVRGDHGTENVFVRDFQEFLRPTGHREAPFMLGSSTANQRIESFWAFLRKECVQFWMDLLQDLQQRGDFTGNYLDKSLIQFCFMSLLQMDLDKTTDVWNGHIIRPSRNDRVPSGRPLLMYYSSHLWGSVDQLHIVNPHDVDVCGHQSTFRSSIPCDEDVYELCIEIMARDNLELPTDGFKALDLYLHVRREISLLL